MQDANWNVTGLVGNVGGSVVVRERYVYDPYGQVKVLTSNWADGPGTPSWAWYYLHQGGRWDAAAGLYNFRNRDYSPTLGRWMTQDPLGYVDGGSLYQYVKGGPVAALDPLGLAIYDDPSQPPALSDVKEALGEVHGKFGGKIPGDESGSKLGKFGTPQRGNPKRGYRLDPPHPGRPYPENVWHINYWDYTEGKKGRGGRWGAKPIGEMPTGPARTGKAMSIGAGFAMGMILAQAEGLNEFACNNACRQWYADTINALLTGNGTEHIMRGNNFNNCRAALEDAGARAAASIGAMSLPAWFDWLAQAAHDAATGGGTDEVR